MATYNPPIEDLQTFNTAVFQEAQQDDPLTSAIGDLRYVSYPNAQGGLSLPSTTIGVMNAGSLSVSGTTQVNGVANISSDITLNKASGTQVMNLNAPNTTIQTTTNGAPINFSVQSSLGTFANVMQFISNVNPQIIINALEWNIYSITGATARTRVRHGASGETRIENMATGALTGSININTSGTAIRLKPKNGTPAVGTGIAINSTNLLSATAGGSAGTHLCVTINGTLYKIALLQM